MGKSHDMASLHTQGQSHDRIAGPSGNGALDMPAEPNVIGKPVEVTTSMTQKMLSATTGSLMTSLLGMPRVPVIVVVTRQSRTPTDIISQ